MKTTFFLAIAISAISSIGSAQVEDRGHIDFPIGFDQPIPKIVFVLDSDNTTDWKCQNINLQESCGDLDGCNITLSLQHKIDGTDMVRGVEERIFMEHSMLSNNKHPGTHGYTRQQSGGEMAWITGTAAKYHMFAPWGWIYMQNYEHQLCPGNRGRQGNAFPNPYDFQMLVHPHVRALIMIED